MAAAMSLQRPQLFSTSAASRRVMVPRAALTTKVAKRAATAQPASTAEPAAPQPAKKPAGFELGFTPENEVFLSRVSMAGFGASVVGEWLSGGQGPLAQLGYTLGLQETQVGLFVAGLIGFNLLASLAPGSATFKAAAPSKAADASAVGPLADWRVTPLQPSKYFGVTNWGFTPANELFAGRVSQLGWVAALIGELNTGLGPVGQLSAETGVPAQTIFFGLAAWAAFMACTAVDKLTAKRGGASKTTSSRATTSPSKAQPRAAPSAGSA